MEMKKWLMPLAVLVIAAILSVILWCIAAETYKDWQPTAGTITHTEIRFRRRRPGKWIEYTWKYSVDGVEYSGCDWFAPSGTPEWQEGDKKEIWYDPDRPSESQFSKPSPKLLVCTPFIFAVPLMLAAYSLSAKKEGNGLRR